ncbi:MAG: hypothetical protein HOQ05_01630 [Corynebacteriales bacterium]|nr:hypothetical protein [Mycobacteriales bacterium]
MTTTTSGKKTIRTGGSSDSALLPTPSYRRADDPRWMRKLSNFTAVVLFLFVVSHIGILALARVSPDAFNSATSFYQLPAGALVVWVLVAMLLFQALSAVRIALVDLTKWGASNAKKLRGMISPLWFALMIPASYYLLRHAAAVMFGDA